MKLRSYLLLQGLGVLTAYALNPSKSLTQYTTTIWTRQHGLPQDTIRTIAQTTDGYLWLGTDEGLARFDGYEFVNFTKDQGRLASNSITSLAASRDGSLWIGTSNGLTHYAHRHFQTYTTQNGLPGNSISALFEDAGGMLWIVAGGSLSRFDGQGFRNYNHEQDIPIGIVRGVAENREHVLHVSGLNSVGTFQNGHFHALLEPGTVERDFPGGILVDHAGNLWVLGVRGLIERTVSGRIVRYGSRDGLPDSFGLNAILEDRDGNLWLGTDDGLARFEAGRFRTLAQSGAQLRVLSLFEDREGNLWAGTDYGLMRVRDDTFTVFGKREGLPSDEPNAVFEDHAGRLWVGFLDAGLHMFSSGNLASGGQSELTKDRVYSVREAPDGEVLVAGRFGLLRVKNGRTRAFLPPDPQGRKRVYDAIADSTGRIWLATPNGLGELVGDQWRTVIPAAGPLLFENSFVTLAKAADGSLWAGTAGSGLWHVSEKGNRLYTAADGLSSNRIRFLYPDGDGTLWICTFGGGLNALRNGHFSRYMVADGLLSDNVSNVIDDGADLWLSTTRGISRISKRQLSDFAQHRIQHLRPVNYGVDDGLRSSQSTPDIGMGGIRRSDGSLWFVTSRGIAVYSGKPPPHREPPPPVYVMGMTADNREFDGSKAPPIPAGNGRVEMRYAAIYLSAPERVNYDYKLEGLDPDWVNAGSRRVVTYNSLGHGRYQFRVRGEVSGGTVGEAVYSFDILPHYYETAWFRLLCASLLLGCACLAYQVRLRQLRLRFALVLKERLRLAREIHDTLAQAFVGISSQLDALETYMPPDLRSAHIYLDLARRMAQHSLTEARRSVMDLRSTMLDTQDLPAALESGARTWAEGSGVNLELDITKDVHRLPEDVEQNLLRIAQEAVTNALKHARASNIALRLGRHNGHLTLSVEDNGCGFDMEDAFVSMGGHFGLIGLRERSEQIGGQLRLESQPGKGTQIEVCVPLP
jgi:ligand-binding sensor domain-containing protein/two-component sensor histidine kinase